MGGNYSKNMWGNLVIYSILRKGLTRPPRYGGCNNTTTTSIGGHSTMDSMFDVRRTTGTLSYHDGSYVIINVDGVGTFQYPHHVPNAKAYLAAHRGEVCTVVRNDTLDTTEVVFN
jgi:hypothetical protein